MSSIQGGWLEKGLEILASQGPGGLTIDNLVSSMGKTKGAFYHHFQGSGDFARRLVAYWQETYTRDIIARSRQGKSPNEKLRSLVRSTLKIPRKTELAFRSWALYNADVEAARQQCDEERMGYLTEIFTTVSGDPQKARLKAFKIYSAFIGYQQLASHIVGNKSPYIIELFEIANYELNHLQDKP